MLWILKFRGDGFEVFWTRLSVSIRINFLEFETSNYCRWSEEFFENFSQTALYGSLKYHRFLWKIRFLVKSDTVLEKLDFLKHSQHPFQFSGRHLYKKQLGCKLQTRVRVNMYSYSRGVFYFPYCILSKKPHFQGCRYHMHIQLRTKRCTLSSRLS